jgi:hypothetical protein
MAQGPYNAADYAINSVLAWTVGLPWKVSGTVDPFTKDSLAHQQAEENVRAQGLDPNDPANNVPLTQAEADALNNIDQTVATTPQPKIDCSKPSGDLLTGFYCSLKKFETYIVVIAILLIAVYLGGKYLDRGRK